MTTTVTFVMLFCPSLVMLSWYVTFRDTFIGNSSVVLIARINKEALEALAVKFVARVVLRLLTESLTSNVTLYVPTREVSENVPENMFVPASERFTWLSAPFGFVTFATAVLMVDPSVTFMLSVIESPEITIVPPSVALVTDGLAGSFEIIGTLRNVNPESVEFSIVTLITSDDVRLEYLITLLFTLDLFMVALTVVEFMVVELSIIESVMLLSVVVEFVMFDGSMNDPLLNELNMVDPIMVELSKPPP